MKQDPFYRGLGQRLAIARIEAGYTQEEVALLLEPPVSRAQVGQLETGQRRVHAHTLVQLAHILETTPEALLGV